jgi:hypothetical protein
VAHQAQTDHITKQMRDENDLRDRMRHALVAAANEAAERITESAQLRQTGRWYSPEAAESFMLDEKKWAAEVFTEALNIRVIETILARREERRSND